MAADEAFVRVEALARASFCWPRNHFADAASTRHYRPDFDRDRRQGEQRAVVCAGAASEALAAVCYYQLRPTGELYIRELAANPPLRAHKLPRAGTLLLAHALVDGLEAARERVLLHVLASHRVSVPPGPRRPGWRDPTAYYQRLGLAASPAGARDSLGRRGEPGDLWLAGDLGAVLERTLAFVGATTTR